MVDGRTFTYEAVDYAALVLWANGDHTGALEAFCRSQHLLGAGIEMPNTHDTGVARALFEMQFVAHRVRHNGEPGLVTGYYEPVLEGSRTKSATFHVPIYRRPVDLVSLDDDAVRAAPRHTLSHARWTPYGLQPFPVRRQIEQDGVLAQHGLELFYLRDEVDAFFLHVQGSGVISLSDGAVRVGYDGKNGHPYTSIGQVLIAQGEIGAEDMSLERLRRWLQTDRQRARQLMHENKSFVFFRELGPAQTASAVGVHDIALSPLRSLAVDASLHRIGLPVYVSAPTLTLAGNSTGFHQLMVAQDVGSAIRGPERGDIFFGVGDAAGALAGATKHAATFFVLLPKEGNGAVRVPL